MCFCGTIGNSPPTALAFHGQTASLVVGEANPSGIFRRTEDSVLLAQLVNDSLLLSIDPAREDQEEEGERRRQRIHWRKLDSGARRFQGGVSWRFVTGGPDGRGFRRRRLDGDFSGVWIRPGFRTARPDGGPEMRFAEWHDAVQALGLD